MYRKNIAVISSLAVLLMAGCSSTPEKPKADTSPLNEKVEARNEQLYECLNADGFVLVHRECNTLALEGESPEAQKKANIKITEKVSEGGPDFQLLAAVLSEDAEGVKEAIQTGADVNRVFLDSTLYGSGARHPNDKKSILFIASQQMNLELIEVLLNAGADPNLRPDPESNNYDFVANSFIMSRYSSNKTVYGPDIGLLAIKYGYVPTEKGLDYMESWLDRRLDQPLKAKMVELYEKLLRISENQSYTKTMGSESKAEQICELHQQIGQENRYKYPMDVGDGNRRFLDLSKYNSQKDACEVTLRYETSVGFWAKVVMGADQRYDMSLAKKFLRTDSGHDFIEEMVKNLYEPQFKSMDRPEMVVTLELSFKNKGMETKRIPMFSD
jgi:hypothetical protein